MHPQRAGDWLREQLEGVSRLTVVSPFITGAGLEGVLGVVNRSASIRVYTRWHAAEVAAGVSDTGIWDRIVERGGEIFLHPLLHAKAYISDESAFIGSANTSLRGLGWRDIASVELLIRTTPDEPNLRSLMELLERTSAEATERVKEEVERRAEQLAVDALPLDEVWAEGGSGVKGEKEGMREERGEGMPDLSVPRYRMPEAVWPAYRGFREERIREMVLRDLASLGVPRGVEDRDSFYAIVGSALLQGFSGKLIQELRGLPAVTAAQKYSEMRAEVGVPVQDGDLEGDYRALVRWVNEFVPSESIVPSGYSIS